MAETKEQRTERLLRARDAARASGRRVGGNAPYGWRTERGRLVQVAEEQHVRWLILHMAGQGWSVSRIGDQLAALHITTRNGQAWSPKTLRGILTRAQELADTG